MSKIISNTSPLIALLKIKQMQAFIQAQFSFLYRPECFFRHLIMNVFDIR